MATALGAIGWTACGAGRPAVMGGGGGHAGTGGTAAGGAAGGGGVAGAPGSGDAAVVGGQGGLAATGGAASGGSGSGGSVAGSPGGDGGPGSGGAATGGASIIPGTGGRGTIGNLCPSGVKNHSPCTTDPPCWNTCGPLYSGFKNCTCVAGMWDCPICEFPAGPDYSCFQLPPVVPLCPQDPTDPSGFMVPAIGAPCAFNQCTPCGSAQPSQGYRDATGVPKSGFCVCTSALALSCATPAEWPPQN